VSLANYYQNRITDLKIIVIFNHNLKTNKMKMMLSEFIKRLERGSSSNIREMHKYLLEVLAEEGDVLIDVGAQCRCFNLSAVEKNSLL
jgi:hypothetical protein